MSTSYRQTIEELKKIKKAEGGNLQNHQKPILAPFDPFDGSSPDPPEKKDSAQGEHTWQGFYPDLETAAATREEWNFAEISIPSHTDPGKVDVWMVGERVNGDDGPGFQFRFLRSEPRKGGPA